MKVEKNIGPNRPDPIPEDKGKLTLNPPNSSQLPPTSGIEKPISEQQKQKISSASPLVKAFYTARALLHIAKKAS